MRARVLPLPHPVPGVSISPRSRFPCKKNQQYCRRMGGLRLATLAPSGRDHSLSLPSRRPAPFVQLSPGRSPNLLRPPNACRIQSIQQSPNKQKKRLKKDYKQMMMMRAYIFFLGEAVCVLPPFPNQVLPTALCVCDVCVLCVCV